MSDLPDKQFFKIGEVSRILAVKPHVLRYWETEFAAIRPQKSRTNQRLYRRRDVELLLEIQELLYKQGYTISGAKKRLRELTKMNAAPRQADQLASALALRQQVVELIELINDEE